MLRFALNASGAFLLMASTAFAHEYKLGALEIDHPYARETMANAPVAGGYMTIRNTGDTSDVLIGGSADFAGVVQIHEMKMDGDVMKMREIEGGLEIPPGGEVVLEPGGFHIMFMKLTEPLKAGEKRPVRLEFRQAGGIDVEFNVEAMTPGGDMNHDHMDHSKSGHTSETHATMDHANMSHATGSDAEQITSMLKHTFDRPDAPLTVEPVVISGDWAVAGWAQDGRGGRGLMKKDAQGWFVLMCSGAAFRQADKLIAAGVPHHDAMAIAAGLDEQESGLGAAATALFDGFEGMVDVGRSGHHGHGDHKN